MSDEREIGGGAGERPAVEPGSAPAGESRRAEEAALAALAGADPSTGPGAADDPPARLDVELLGLLAYGLDELAPAPGLGKRVLAAARGEERRAAVTAFPRPVAPARQEEARRPPLPHWLVATAAALALAVVGLGAVTTTLVRQLDLQGAALVRLADELEESRRRGQLLALAQGALERRSLSLAGQLALVANPGVEVCPLGPIGSDPLQPRARGLLFLSMADRQWYVRVAELEPAPPGRVYRLWFLTAGGGAMSAGELEPGPDEAISLGGRRLPDPAVMDGVAITLEVAGEEPRRPSGPMVLFGDEKMTII
ncbi:MAG TPA: anti-sigma factor [Thermoanaerobaculia bacterium]|nr:anti-sigma factor [Thermoanaerobaculia bacterium]